MSRDATRTIVEGAPARSSDEDELAVESTLADARAPAVDPEFESTLSDAKAPAVTELEPTIESLPREVRPPPMSAAPETVIFGGRYQVKGVLGGGAMGTVYRALDRALDEPVALKLLKRELAVSPELVERFRREVKLSRRVTHRNVARVFDIGAHGQQPFLTMELVDGISLAEILARRGALPPREVHSIALDLCAGLGAAHDAGVVHRDLKPENVLVETGGRVVVTDFGVACALTERDLPHGAAGALVGSPAYMAPEQVEGTTDPDARADIYAFGVMLYELCTGKMPWEGGSIFAIAAARLVRPPPDPRARVPDLPATLAEVVVRAMARKREDRFASVEEIVTALARSSELPATVLAPPPPPDTALRRPANRAVAVMPLVNGLGAEAEYFARGYVAELLGLLGALQSLQVRQTPATAGDGPREVGRSLGVQTVVSGTLERTLEGVRLTVRLVTVEDGLNLWLRRIEASSVLQLALTARAHANEIAQILDADGDAPAARETPVDPRSADFHMQGRFAYQRAWYEANESAVQLLETAHILAPREPTIAATLALALAREYGTGGGGEPAANRARELAEQALAAAPQLADARVALAALHAYDGEGVAAAGELRRALAAMPDEVEALDWTGRLLVEVGDPERGLAYLDRAYALEPALIVSRLSATLARALVGDWQRVDHDFSVVPPDPADRVMHWIYRARVGIWRGEVSLPLPDLSTLPGTGAASIMAMFHILMSRRIEPHIRGLVEQMLPTRHSSTVAPRRAILNAQLRAELLAYAGLVDEAAAALADADTTGIFDLVWLERCPAIAPLRSLPDWSRIHRSVATRAARVRAALGSKV
ncbi:MAG: protein kinase [Labilithrix sp.]|nr:protein kinase [Labilithrix sp.]MCW5816312.1 protein kinase [Labilithrix sp.]